MSSGSFSGVGFIRLCPWGRLLPSGSLGSFGCTLGVNGFIRVCPGGRRVNLESLVLFVCALGIDGLIGVVGFIGGRWVGLGWMLQEFVWFIRGR